MCARDRKFASSAATIVSKRSQREPQSVFEEQTTEQRTQIELWIPEPTSLEEILEDSSPSIEAGPSRPPCPPPTDTKIADSAATIGKRLAAVTIQECRNMCECERVNCVHEMWLHRSLYTWDCSAE